MRFGFEGVETKILHCWRPLGERVLCRVGAAGVSSVVKLSLRVCPGTPLGNRRGSFDIFTRPPKTKTSHLSVAMPVGPAWKYKGSRPLLHLGLLCELLQTAQDAYVRT